jgi:hypothetical protein
MKGNSPNFFSPYPVGGWGFGSLSHQDSISKSQKVKTIGVTYTGPFSLLRPTVPVGFFFHKIFPWN